jgi:D-alanine transaminase
VPDIAVYNGEFTTLEQAKAPVNDRAFVFGDGIYEVVKVIDGSFFGLDLHLDRLYRSAEGIELVLPWDRQWIKDLLSQLHTRSGYRSSLVYLQVSRGVHPRRHYFPPENTVPAYAAWVTEFMGTPAQVHADGVSVVTVPDERWTKCWIKSLNLLPNCMARDVARRAGAYEAILIDRVDGLVNECSASNVFAVIGGVVRTAPKSRNILYGISRNVAIQCAQAAGIPLEERAFSVAEMTAADEVFLTSTSPDVLGIVSVDGVQIGNGRPGPITMRLLDLFRHYQRTGSFRTS